MKTKRSIDPFTVEVIKRALVSAAEQMFAALGRTSKSSVIYEVLDYGCAITDAKARMIAQANGIPPFIGVLTDAVADAVAKFGLDGLAEGDIVITNDPYMGGATHQNDVVLRDAHLLRGSPDPIRGEQGPLERHRRQGPRELVPQRDGHLPRRDSSSPW